MHEQPDDSATSPENVSPGAAEPSTPSPESTAPPEPQAPAEAEAPLTATAVETSPPEPAEASEDAAADSGEFAKMLEASEAKGKGGVREVKTGDRVKGKIVSMTDDTAFVEFGGRAEGALPVAQIKDGDGNPTKKVGDAIEATVTATEGQIALALAVKRVDRKSVV